MTTRNRYVNGVIESFDDVTQEMVNSSAPNFWWEDFVGASHAAGIPTSVTQGYPWVKKIVGSGPPTVAPIANASGGQVQLVLTATSEKEDAALYYGDSLCWDFSKGLVFEARAALTVPPSAAGVQVVIGLASAWIDGPDNFSRYIEFGCTANANLLCRSQDGVTQNSIAAAPIGGAAITLDTNFHNFRIRAVSDRGDLEFALDGNRVNVVNALAFTKSDSTAILQPYFAVYKPSGTGLATLVVDKIVVASNR